MAKPLTVDDYRAELPAPTRERLDQVRRLIAEELPEAAEVISYGMPTFRVGRASVVHLAAWQRHLSLYPAPDDEELAAPLAPYLAGKGTLQFAHDRDLPLDLIRRVVRALAGRRGLG